MEKPLVSFIVVSYNHSAFLTECLDSIYNQTYKNWELIIADDASTDNSSDIAKNWINKYNLSVETNFHTENRGFATTLNECLELAKGKYVNIIAADDYLHPDFLTKCVNSLESKDESYGMVFSSAFLLNEDSSISNYHQDFSFYKNAIQFRKELKKLNYVSALGTLVKKNVLIETGLYDSNILIEDYDRWLRINEKYLIDFVPMNLGYYRKHAENISTLKQRTIAVEEVLLRMKYDGDLENRLKINNDIRKIYISSRDRKELKKVSLNYKKYKGKTCWLNFCLKFRIPVKLYELKYKILNVV